MSTLDDILNQRDAAIAILQRKIDEAVDLRDGRTAAMDDVINALVAQQAHLAAQAYIAGLDHPTMARAMAALHAATNQMNTVAARMVSATTFVTNLVNLRSEANKVVSALKGNG
jgi:hypothetical protein